MTWNVKTGGIDRGGRHRAPVDRLGDILAVIDQQRPDILALQELRGFDRRGGEGMRAFAAAAGMDAHLARSAFGQPVAVLVRPPLRMTRRSAVRWRLHHAAAIATVPTDAGPLRVVSTHLNPFSPERRRREARWLAARYGSRRRLVALVGDLNSLDPGTDHAERLARLAVAYRHRHLAADGTADTRAMAAFAAGGLVDVWPGAGAGDPLTAPTAQGGGAEFSGMRLDYVLASRPLAARVLRGYVARGGAAGYASDHYPVVVDVDLDSPG